jgi:acyl-homoserine-lactone acylase
MSARPAAGVDVYRDAFGVPHVFASDLRGAYYGLGYASAQDRPRTLPLHQRALQGRLAEALGDVPVAGAGLKFLDAVTQTPWFRGYGETSFALDGLRSVDAWMRLFGYFERAERALGDVSDRTATVLTAFCDGVNAYYDAHGAPAGFERYEPATELAWWMWFEHTISMAFFISNSWAAGPQRTSDGTVLLGGDPHYWCLDGHGEAHIVAGDFEVSGVWDGHVNVGFWGGTNGHIAVGITAGGLEGATVYRERLDPEDRDRYWDWRAGGYGPIEATRHSIATAGADPHLFVARATHHGPIVAERMEDGAPVAYSVRSAYLEDPAACLEQHLDLWSVRSAPDFLAFVADAPYIRGHRVAGDRHGNIAYTSNGPLAVRDESVDWSGPVDGSVPETEWGTERWRPGAAEHGLPAILNPRGGFIQSANDPPWLSTVPPEETERFPHYVFPEGWRELGLRGVRQRRVLAGPEPFGVAEGERLLYDADVMHARLGLEALGAELARHEDLGARLSPDARRLADVLAAWDGIATRESAGMTAALYVHRALEGGIPVPPVVPTADPVAEPEARPPEVDRRDAERYVLALERAAVTLLEVYGTLERPWGDVHVYVRAGHEVGVAGGSNELRALFVSFRGWWLEPDEIDPDGVERGNFGSRTMRLTQLGEHGARVWSMAAWGQVPMDDAPDSPHGLDQLELYAAQRLKPLPLTLDEVRESAALAQHERCNHASHAVLDVPPEAHSG